MDTLVVMYTEPADVEGFMTHYEGTHMPLAQAIPDAQWTLTRITGTPRGGKAPYFLKAEAVFPSADAMQAAMRTPEMGATSKDAAEMVGRFGNEAVMLVGERAG